MEQVYELNKDYYERNAEIYEKSSWYFTNKYKDRTLSQEIKKCLGKINKESITVLEIGAGTGYLLGKLVSNKGVIIDYTGLEHSSEMSRILISRYHDKVGRITIINESVSIDYLKEKFGANNYDLIIGSSILHHLPDYEQIIDYLPKLLNKNGIIYFVREPIFNSECNKGSQIQNISNNIYQLLNNFFLIPGIKKLFWPRKVKQEDTQKIAIHMFKNGVSIKPFLELTKCNFEVVIYRKYNRRATCFLSYLENKWLSFTRKDVFGNTLFAIGIQKIN